MKTIRNYISSDGSIKNLLVDQIGKEGYLQLIKESIEVIDRQLEVSPNRDEIQALTELKESYQKTLNGEQPKRAWTFEEGVNYLDHCKLIASQHVHQLNEGKAPRKFRNEVTRYKDYWRKHLPIRVYLGAIKLSPEKYDSISEGIDYSIDWMYV